MRGEAAELARVGGTAAPAKKAKKAKAGAPENTTPEVMLAHTWDASQDVTGWWMSEKLDGVRAWWDGEKFSSRNGNAFSAPEWFIDDLPKMALDGELFGGRGKFQQTVSVVRRSDAGEEWRKVKYVVFDAPELDATFEDRLEHFTAKLKKSAAKHAAAHPHQTCKSIDHLKKELARVEGLGGEGLMLRKPGSRYEAGRSSSLLKVKSFRDAEAKVVGHLPGEGRHKGRLGALEAEMPDGKKFSIGTGFSDAEREKPPKIGAVVTYRYFELTPDGVPRFPSYVGVRTDLSWAQIKKGG
ncbi:MAG: DNA ligase [Myxococcaceae bacterium]